MSTMTIAVPTAVPPRSRRRIRWGSILMTAYVGLITVFLTLPVLVVILASFDAADYVQFPPEGLTLRWYARVWNSASIMGAITNSAIVGLFSTLLAVGVGVPASVLIARGEFRGRNALYAFALSPLTVPWVVFGLALLYLWIAARLPLNLTALVVGHAVMGLPYVVRTCVGVLVGISPNYELAARTLGAGRVRTFLSVTFPMMQMGVVAGAAFCLLLSFVNVPVALFLTTTSTLTVQIAVFSYMLSNYDPSVAALATIQLVIIIAGLAITQRIANVRDMLL